MPTLTALETVTLEDPSSQARAVVAPSRGGLITRWSVGGREVLFLDEASLVDLSKNVRGGVPILFPSPGKLAGGKYTRAGRAGAMGQHGFARNLPWSVAAMGPSCELRLEADASTVPMFDWDFALTYRVTLGPDTLRIDQVFENRSADAMPFACGFHPYFHVPQADKARTRVETKATRAFDNRHTQEITLPRGHDSLARIDLTQDEVDLHLEDHDGPLGKSGCALVLADGARVELTGSKELARWVIWTLAGKDFVCVEPWSAPADALNTGRSILEVAPHGSCALWTELRLR
ncbi:MAG: galactose mutarotase [Deltaproteobacteria bacterium]|nr:galactose mutarotase [Deltaproteobacteria bacterium]